LQLLSLHSIVNNNIQELAAYNLKILSIHKTIVFSDTISLELEDQYYYVILFVEPIQLDLGINILYGSRV